MPRQHPRDVRIVEPGRSAIMRGHRGLHRSVRRSGNVMAPPCKAAMLRRKREAQERYTFSFGRVEEKRELLRARLIDQRGACMRISQTGGPAVQLQRGV